MTVTIFGAPSNECSIPITSFLAANTWHCGGTALHTARSRSVVTNTWVAGFGLGAARLVSAWQACRSRVRGRRLRVRGRRLRQSCVCRTAGNTSCRAGPSRLMVGEDRDLPLRLRPQNYVPDRPQTYSNPLGLTLTQVRENVWMAERPFYPTLPGLQGIDVGGKMVVVRLPDGTLWVHSPVGLDTRLQEELAKLGRVAHIVTPNTEHQKWAGQWISAYPDAVSYACPGLMEKKPDVGWQRSLEELVDRQVTSAVAPEVWGGALELCWVQDRWPLVTERPFFNEVVFCHRPSKTLIVTDLWLNYPDSDDVPRGTRIWKWVMEDIYMPVYNNFMRTATWRESYDTIMSWDFDCMLTCHGEPVKGDCKGTLARYLDMPPA